MVVEPLGAHYQVVESHDALLEGDALLRSLENHSAPGIGNQFHIGATKGRGSI